MCIIIEYDVLKGSYYERWLSFLFRNGSVEFGNSVIVDNADKYDKTAISVATFKFLKALSAS